MAAETRLYTHTHTSTHTPVSLSWTSHFQVLCCVQRANYMTKLSFHFLATEWAKGGLSTHPSSGIAGSIGTACRTAHRPPPTTHTTCALIMFTWLIHARWLLVKLMRHCHCFCLSASARGRFLFHPPPFLRFNGPALKMYYKNHLRALFTWLLFFHSVSRKWVRCFALNALSPTNKARENQTQHDGHCKDDLQSVPT